MDQLKAAASAVLLVTTLAACGSSGATSGPASRSPVGTPSPVGTSPIGTRSEVPSTSARAEVFVAALGGRSRPEDRGSRPQVYVRDKTYCSELLRQQPCDPVPIPLAEQRAVVAALGPRVHFTARPPKDPDFRTHVVVTLGMPHIAGDDATVSVETECGPLCGEGETLQLQRRADRWLRTGTIGPSWIS